MKKVKILANLTEAQVAALKKMSKQSAQPVTVLLRLAVDQFLANGGVAGIVAERSRQ